MKKYPYIGKSLSGVVLFIGEGDASNSGQGFVLESRVHSIGNTVKLWDKLSFKDITHEYLSNTKIKIESPEHSEFVQQLAFNGGFAWRGGVSECKNTEKPFLYFSDSSRVTWDGSDEHFNAADNEEIKIPLPKIKEQKGAPQMQVKPIYTKEMKDNGELPPVGYEFDGLKVKFNEPDSAGDLILIDNIGEYRFKPLSEVPTTKTPEKVMIDKLTEKLTGFTDIYAGDSISIQKAIASAVIYGEISGLTYKGE